MCDRIRKTLESKSNMEEDRTSSLEAQLGQAKQIAEEADKKYDEVRAAKGYVCLHIHGRPACFKIGIHLYFNHKQAQPATFNTRQYHSWKQCCTHASKVETFLSCVLSLFKRHNFPLTFF